MDAEWGRLMRPLKRPAGPTCLNAYKGGRDPWPVAQPCYEAVMQSLTAMQGRMCAYCERIVDAQHVEHFAARHSHPHLTFAWTNLFASCNSRDSCGTHKDGAGKPYNLQDLIDPANEDPDAFLFFQDDGSVAPRPGLSPASRHRAEETIRVFNLRSPALVERRAQVVRDFLNADPGLIETLETFAEAERRALLQDYLELVADGPHPTPLRHLLTTLGP
jgi:uncharacterized protein (TIGR02646 family)